MTSVKSRRRTTIDRRSTIVEASFRVAAECGLNNLTTSAVSREAGIAAGTLFLYFETKESLINALYIHLIQCRQRAITAGLEDAGTLEDKFRTFWYSWARWYLEEPEVSRVIHQCESSAILTRESALFREELDEAIKQRFFPESEYLKTIPLRQQVFYSIMIGPIQVLAQLRDKGEISITDAILDETYRRVRRALED